MIDFAKLKRPKTRDVPINPIEIFKRTPNNGHVPNDLWKGQADALSQWHTDRTKADNLIILNTGAGKSVIGLLAAQSLVNEGIPNVLFVCSTIDLVEQTAREADYLGLAYSKRVRGNFSNDKFETGASFCITTYQALFTSRTVFKNPPPGGIVFDDAHVAEGLIRDSLTVKVSKQSHSTLYDDLIALLRNEFVNIGKADHLDYVMDDENHAITLCPPLTARRNAPSIIEIFKRFGYEKYKALRFPFTQIRENISCCAIYLSSKEIEISPPFIPSSHFQHVHDCHRRIYLSATLDYMSGFVRAFGSNSFNKIEPDNDAGNGERLIILGSLLEDCDGKLEVAKNLISDTKVIVSVPSYLKAEKWSDICVNSTKENFSFELEEFRKQKTGAFCLVSRIDGIDLPKDTCRIMIIDGSPLGSTLQEQYQVEMLGLMSQEAVKMSMKLTQLLGRINRGRSDYGAFILYGNDLNNWCKNDKNIALLPELIRKQFLLGRNLQEQIGKSSNEEIANSIRDVLGVNVNKIRSKTWLDFYSDTINGLEVDCESLKSVKIRECELSKGAVAESRFMGSLWHGDIEAARTHLLSKVDAVASVDSKLAGWYDLWLGMTYEADEDLNSASMHYSRARLRLTPKLNVPVIRNFRRGKEELVTSNPVLSKLAALSSHGAEGVLSLNHELRRAVDALSNSTGSVNKHEDACRLIGELIGFEAVRPDNDHNVGPDVIWSSEEDHVLIAFELKTQKKDMETIYRKEEIGQCLNHLEWLKDNYPQYCYHGVTIIGPVGKLTKHCSPGEKIFLTTADEFRCAIMQFAARIESLVGMSEADRWQMVKVLGNSPEFQLSGFSASFSQRKLSQMR